MVATFWVFVSVGFYLVSLNMSVPGFGSSRAVAGLLLVLGSFACGAGADKAAFTSRGVTTPVVAALRVGGVALLASGLTAVVTGSAVALAVLAVGIGVMWLATTARHLLRPAASQTATAAPETERVPTGASR
ncbi:MAG TPA: hypothetical protein VFJ17_05005 [Mycobacteriales bacterium]|nr:hypothetical protein [Mycobacteriales bacterium]